MSLTRLRNGMLYDPANGIDGERRDITIRDGRIVANHDARNENIAPEHDFDASGMVVMASGIDLHSHIGGGKTNLSRLLLPEDHRNDSRSVPNRPGEGRYMRMPSCGVCTPGTLAVGYRLPKWATPPRSNRR